MCRISGGLHEYTTGLEIIQLEIDLSILRFARNLQLRRVLEAIYAGYLKQRLTDFMLMISPD